MGTIFQSLCHTSLSELIPLCQGATGCASNRYIDSSSIELSGQPGETSREPIDEASRGEVTLASVSPGQNSKLPLKRGSFFIKQTGAGGSPFSVILDSVAKRSQAQNEGFIKPCPGGIVTGSCENGHRFAKEVYCGKEWCKVCNGKWEKGHDMKPSHARRFARWYPKAQQIASLGYFTFTIPMERRWEYRSKKSLSKLSHDVSELLKAYGFNRGLRRFHWFGDTPGKWNPHLNVLVDGGLLNGKALRAIRRAYSKLLGVDLAIAEYHYLTSPGEKVHALKYVTRATFLDAKWDVPMALELRGFRNQLWWGSKRWAGRAVWSLDDLPGERAAGTSDIDTRAVAALELGYCPLDGLPIVWERWQPISRLPEMGGRSIGAGYWILPGVSPPPYRLDFSGVAGHIAPLGEYKRSVGGNYLPSPIAEARWTEFSVQHRRFVANWSLCRELEKADRALVAEVDELAESRGIRAAERQKFISPTV